MATVAPGVRLRPLVLSELFDEVFRLYRRRFLLLWLASLFAVIPALIVTVAAASLFAAFGLFSQDATAPDFGSAGPAILAVTVIAGLAVIALLPFSAFLPWRATMAAVLGEEMTIGQLLQAVGGSYWRLWLLALGYFGLILLVSIPAITCVGVILTAWLYVKWCVTIPAWFAEEQQVGSALRRSWSLVDGNWWRVFGILLLFFLLAQVIGTALNSFTLVAAFVPPRWMFVAQFSQLAVELLLNTFVNPLAPLVTTLIYLDLRVRHEHLDLQVMARRLAGDQSIWPPAPAPYYPPPPPPPLPPGAAPQA